MRTTDQTDGSFGARGDNEYKALRDFVWSSADNLFIGSDPNTGMYHVTADTEIPYNVLGNKQDEPTYRGPSNSRLQGARRIDGIPRGMWHHVGGGESGWATPDPTNPNNLEKVSGRGILLMRTFMDEVEFNSAGNEVLMVKRPDKARAQERHLLLPEPVSPHSTTT